MQHVRSYRVENAIKATGFKVKGQTIIIYINQAPGEIKIDVQTFMKLECRMGVGVAVPSEELKDEIQIPPLMYHDMCKEVVRETMYMQASKPEK